MGKNVQQADRISLIKHLLHPYIWDVVFSGLNSIKNGFAFKIGNLRTKDAWNNKDKYVMSN